ncbi:MAG: DUF3592 domain-containing protein [Bacteroidota bacterium]
MSFENEHILDEAFIRARPPRRIDFFSRSTIFFSGFMSQFGWLFFGFGLIFFWVFGGAAGIKHFSLFEGDWQPTKGVILSTYGTSSSINETTVYGNDFTYTINGNEYFAISYTTGNRYYEGQEIDVEYKNRNPDKARIVNSRMAHFPFWTSLITLIFPFVGLVFILVGMRRNIRANYLMKYGVFTRGERLSKEATNTTINDQPVYKYEFTFTSDDKSYIATCSTHQTHRVEDDKQEIILYDARNPEISVVYDAIEGYPAIDEDGNMGPVPAGNIIYLIVPGISIIGHGLFILFYYFI